MVAQIGQPGASAYAATKVRMTFDSKTQEAQIGKPGTVTYLATVNIKLLWREGQLYRIFLSGYE